MSSIRLGHSFSTTVLLVVCAAGCSNSGANSTASGPQEAATHRTPSTSSKADALSSGLPAGASPADPNAPHDERKEPAAAPKSFPVVLPRLAEVTQCLDLAELKPSFPAQYVFHANGSLSYSTQETLESVASQLEEQFAERTFQALATDATAMNTLTFQKNGRPATIMLSRGVNPDESIVEMHFWGEVDLSDLTELPGAMGISRTKSSLRYTAPMQVDAATGAVKEKLSQLQWPLARTSSTKGTLTQYYNGGLRFVCHISHMENQELELESGGAPDSTNVYIASGPHFDIAELPTPRLVRRLGASPLSALQSQKYTSTGAPRDVMKVCKTVLQEQGWVSVHPIRPGIGETQALLIQNGCLLQIQASATQDGESEVQYYASMVPFDTPDELETSSLRVDTAAPHLSFVTTDENINGLSDFYASHLMRTGWTMDESQKFVSDKRILSVFHGTHFQPVLVDIRQKASKETWVELRPVDGTEIRAALSNARREPVEPEEQPPSVARDDKIVGVDDVTESVVVPESVAPNANAADLLQNQLAAQLQDALQQATRELRKAGVDGVDTKSLLADLQAQVESISSAAGGASPTDQADSVSSDTAPPVDPGTVDETHEILAENFPIPQGARELKRQADIESISYYTDRVGPDAEFFARQLKAIGFRPRGDSDVDDEFGFMQFQKGNGTIRISFVRDPRNKIPVRVMILGDGLLWPGTEDAFGGDDTLMAEGDDELNAEDDEFPVDDEFATPTEHAGVPLPEKLNAVSTGGSPFLQEVTATKQAELNPVVAFYRDNMKKHGWAENQRQSVVEKVKATLVFAKAGSTATVKLEQFGDEVDLKITIRDAAKAKAAGMVPPLGSARVILANASSGKAMIAIGSKAYELAAGLGAENPADGKKIDIPPGSHNFTIRVGAETQKGKLQVQAGGTWGVIVLPNGVHVADRVY